ncbi:hypothetical protein SAMN05444395_11135 [Flavobacterium fryxellicola]|uniref:Uncharacterized protein n=1 Tax=Flavobacterium fryxellicola TaxID=249352 RepID=A0A167ZKU2_9FLAO|nr:hypothetical protein [Flavobacterium fryxellicola]OAB30556.1 hypothetical protein FBFR_01800 [Flavobacterium fryxellicola]SHN76981.1 hypothetical protein SAMN05444395_11135 [Flavobacterium fryxellicola]
MHTTTTLTTAPFEQGFLNLSNQFIDLVGNHLEPITIYLGNNREPIPGTLYTANPINTPRIRGGNTMSEWFLQNCEVRQILNVSIINPVTFWVYL